MKFFVLILFLFNISSCSTTSIEREPQILIKLEIDYSKIIDNIQGAIFHNEMNIIEKEFKKYPNILLNQKYAKMVFSQIIFFNKIKILQYIFHNKIKYNQNIKTMKTNNFIIDAAWYKHYKILKILLKNGFSPIGTNKFNMNLVYISAINNSKYLLKIAKIYNIDPTQVGFLDKTPLQFADPKFKKNIIRYIKYYKRKNKK